jgi:hypothetical protein
VPEDALDVRSSLIRQWELIAQSIAGIDLSAPSRVDGWTNREVFAHLYVQPRLVAKFLRSESGKQATQRVPQNLGGTKSFSELIDSSAREGAALNKVNLGIPLAEVRSLVLSADLNATIDTFQGSISVSDYLVTRCVEAVVHGSDLVEPVAPDLGAQWITAQALLDTLAVAAPDLMERARALPIADWIDIATGRAPAPEDLSASMPVMS